MKNSEKIVKFEWYVINHDFNNKKAYMFNVFNNIRVHERTEKAVRKYLRSPKKFRYYSFHTGDYVYGFEGFVREIDSAIRCEESFRCEYEIAVGDIFTPEVHDILREIDSGRISKEDLYDVMKKLDSRNNRLEKWDCYMQCAPNMVAIAHEVIRQYKEQMKNA